MSAYAELEAIFRRISALRGASSMLGWDNATMLPEKSSNVRGEQLAVLAEISHDMICTPKLAELFNNAKAEALSDWQAANLREMKRQWQHETCVPAALVGALTKASNASEHAWRAARQENDFKGFLPHFSRVLSLVREVAQAKAEALHLSPYDALLDLYDPGTRSATVDVIFEDLAAFLPEFIGSAIECQAKQPPPLPIKEIIPSAKQKALGLAMMQKLGFDFTRGRLDESTHPFCGGVPGDVRLTTRYDEHDFLSGFFGVLHETGHALYEMGLPEVWRNQPVGEARGMSMHESQSLLVEMQLSQSREFLIFAAPIIQKTLGVSGAEWSAENIQRNVSIVQPSFIRVDADEATYPAHVILRYRLEKAMIAGELEAADLPMAWAEQMQKLLGITPSSDREGCLQDIHWPDGSFGYFPTYTLGAMTAAQLFAAAKKVIPNLMVGIKKGELTPLFEWLKVNVHSLGSKLSTPELIQYATGQTLDPSIYKAHLTQRYLA